MTAGKQHSHPRLSGLDLLRAFAILFVICHHYESPSTSALWTEYLKPLFAVMWSGVDLFFVLSGYLIASQWFSSLEKDKLSWAYKKFYIKRTFRILPSYFLVFALYAMQAVFLTGHQFEVWQYFLFVQNFFDLPIFGISWSLCVEEHFYFIFPITAFFLWQWKKPALAIATGLGALGLTLYLRDHYWHQAVKPLYDSLPLAEQNYHSVKVFYDKIYFPTYCRLDGLTCGVALAAFRRYRPLLWNKLQEKSGFMALIGFIGWIGSVVLVSNKYSWESTVLGFLALSISYSFLVFAATEPTSFLSRRKVPGMERISSLSYAMYLLFPGIMSLIAALTKRVPSIEVDPFFFLFQLMAIILASQTLFTFIEKPALNMRARILKKYRQTQ